MIRAGFGVFFDSIKGAASGTGGGGFSGFNWTTPLVTTYQGDGATPIASVVLGTGKMLTDLKLLRRVAIE